MATKEEKEDLLKIFTALDTNADGQLSRQELLAGFKKILGSYDAEEEVNRIMGQVDTDNNGCIDFSEFVTATIDRKKFLSQKRLKQAYSMFDNDSSGGIDVQELKDIFK